MEVLNDIVSLNDLKEMQPHYFDDMIKGVVDIKNNLLAINADMHVDLEDFLLKNGSKQENLVGINIYYDGEVELDSNINPPINRALGHPRDGRLITDSVMVQKVLNVVERWVNLHV